MYNVNLAALAQTLERGQSDPASLRAAANPLAYCFFGGLACYAMTFALEAARAGVELKALRGTVRTEVDQSRALGLAELPARPGDRVGARGRRRRAARGDRAAQAEGRRTLPRRLLHPQPDRLDTRVTTKED